MPVKAKERGAKPPKTSVEEFFGRLKCLSGLLGGAYGAYLEDEFPILTLKGEGDGGEGDGQCR